MVILIDPEGLERLERVEGFLDADSFFIDLHEEDVGLAYGEKGEHERPDDDDDGKEDVAEDDWRDCRGDCHDAEHPEPVLGLLPVDVLMRVPRKLFHDH